MASTKEGLDTFDHNPRTVRSLTLDYALRPPRRLPVARLAACRGPVALQRSGTSRESGSSISSQWKKSAATRRPSVRPDGRQSTSVGGQFIAGGPKGITERLKQ